ncbi:hypothetical protein MM193_02775 [Limosilactobacillus reuteri]|uniref:hypothetical protein n=1 Tax=Limosilactobacillus reuteri TaxID=1598 RepID=UPI001F4E7A60|nr:hypothetical protein [Limosilactobacillus reuteri]
MASETYDYEPFDNTDHTMKQIADAIRHKGYGKDVREAIAQGMESYDRTSGELFKRMNKVEEKTDREVKERKEENSKLTTRLDNLDKQKATHDDVEGLRKDLQSRINHLYAGDPQTIKAVVTEILEEKGVI